MRIVEVKTGRPIYREQKVIEGTDNFAAAEIMLASIKTELPERLTSTAPARGSKTEVTTPAVAAGADHK